MTPAEMVAEFHRTFDLPDRDVPALPGVHEEILRLRLLQEEFEEYVRALADEDLVEIADALADMVYVIYGTALVYGIPLDRVLEEVHASNMSKVGPDGKPIYREDGKVLKGPNYFRPDVARVLGLEERVVS